MTSADWRRANIPLAKTVALVLGVVVPLLPWNAAVNASHHYTEKQMDALEERVGKTFWLYSHDGKLPTFLDAPSATAAPFHPGNKESFIITEVAGRAQKDPYFAVQFPSGKAAYIRPDKFREALNLTILTVNPFAGEEQKEQQQAAEEKKRLDWIKAQPWPPAVKEAAIKKQPTPGLTAAEVKRVIGTPQRVTKLRGPVKVSEERWFYPDGSVLVITNGLLSRIDKPMKNK